MTCMWANSFSRAHSSSTLRGPFASSAASFSLRFIRRSLRSHSCIGAMARLPGTTPGILALTSSSQATAYPVPRLTVSRYSSCVIRRAASSKISPSQPTGPTRCIFSPSLPLATPSSAARMAAAINRSFGVSPRRAISVRPVPSAYLASIVATFLTGSSISVYVFTSGVSALVSSCSLTDTNAGETAAASRWCSFWRSRRSRRFSCQALTCTSPHAAKALRRP